MSHETTVETRLDNIEKQMIKLNLYIKFYGLLMPLIAIVLGVMLGRLI